MDILTFKALHLVGMVAWFAGLFYLVRLFVYHAEAFQKADPERQILVAQFEKMEIRLFKIITRPAMLITFVGGITMLFLNPLYIQQGWMHIKLALVILLAGYSDYCGVIIKKLAKGTLPMSAERFRLFNEIPTLFLVAVVVLAVFRDLLAPWALVLVLLGLLLVLTLSTMLYKRYRARSSE